MRAFYRVWGRDGHRQKASWQASRLFSTYDGYTIETWCYDRTGTHSYVDVEISCKPGVSHKACELYNELDSQLSDGIFERCNHGRVERLKYSYYWSNGCPTNKDFNNGVGVYEDTLNNYAFDMDIIPYIEPGMSTYFKPVFSKNRFTAVEEGK